MSEDIEGLICDYNDFTEVFIEIEDYLKSNYLPVRDPKEAEMHFTTREIWEKLLVLFPHSAFTQEIVIKIFIRLGYKFYDYGEMRFEWMMKKV